MSDYRFYHISKTGEITRQESLDEALHLPKEGGYVWLDYCQPTREDLSLLIEPLGIHSLSIEDCTDENQVPKIENFPRNTFIIFNSFAYVDQELSIDEVDLFIGSHYLITVSQRDADDRRLLNGIERVVGADIENVRQGPAFLLHVILDHIVDQKFTAIDALEDELDRAEDTVLADVSKFDPGDLMSLRRNLLSLRKSLFHEREILVKICRRDCPFISDKAIYRYRDIYDHLAKFFELTETYRDLVTSLMEMYLSMINNEMSRAANDTNATVRRLTLITTIFMPLSLIAGIGGMSEFTTLVGSENSGLAYLGLFGLMGAIAAISYYLLKWAERRDHQRAHGALARPVESAGQAAAAAPRAAARLPER
jgi:magnesium transporter